MRKCFYSRFVDSNAQTSVLHAVDQTQNKRIPVHIYNTTAMIILHLIIMLFSIFFFFYFTIVSELLYARSNKTFFPGYTRVLKNCFPTRNYNFTARRRSC